jgi:hypothetical protein
MKKNLLSLLAVMLVSMTVFATVPDRVGWWQFDNADDMLAATTGQPLVLTGTQESVAGPEDGNLATLIGIGSFLTMTHGIAPNGGGTLVNEFTLQFDICIPEGNLWHSIYQTTADNSDDGEMFINTDNFIGAWRCGYSANAIEPGTWYRVIISVKNGEFFKIYVDGEIWVDGAAQPIDDRDALQSVLLAFADNDGEDNPIKCAELGIWDVPLTADQAAELGGASSGGTPTIPPRKGLWTFDNADDMLAAEIGLPLTLTGTHESVAGPDEGNLATQIGIGSYLTMDHQIAPNGGGAYVNEFSLQLDFSVPETGIWHAFIQTNVANANDADLFTNTSNAVGVGDLGYSENTISSNTWYRLVISVKNDNFFKIYLNGEIWLDGAGQPLDGRYGLDPQMILFGDNDGDDGLIVCSEAAIWDVALTSDEVALLGDASANTGLTEQKHYSQVSDLGQNYPNPFTRTTTLPYEIVKAGKVGFVVTDMTGRQVRTIEAGVRTPGHYTIELNADGMTTGLYYVRMTVNDRVSTRKIMLVR